MSVLSDILKEEYDRLNNSINAFENKVEELPQGYIVNKKIKNKSYPYLQWRSGDKVKSKYLKAEELDQIKDDIDLRKKYEGDLKEMYASKKEFEKVLGKNL